jgi:hypothetical protein
VKLVAVRRKLDGSQYCLYETSDGRDFILDLPVGYSDKLMSREQALALTLHQAESKAQAITVEEDKPKREWKCWGALGCPGCRFCKPFEFAEQSTEDEKPDAGSTPVADAHGDPAASSQLDSVPAPAIVEQPREQPDIAASVPADGDGVSDIAELKAQVEKLRDWMLRLYVAFVENPQSAQAIRQFDNHQVVFVEAAAKLKELAPEAYRELLAGYEHLLLTSSSPEGKPSIDEATQTIMESRWQLSLSRKPKPVRTDFTWEP